MNEGLQDDPETMNDVQQVGIDLANDDQLDVDEMPNYEHEVGAAMTNEMPEDVLVVNLVEDDDIIQVIHPSYLVPFI